MASIKKRETSTGQTRWDARVRAGTRVFTKTHRTRALAEAWARRQEDAYRSGELVDPDLQRITLNDYADGWMAGRKLAPKTTESYEAALRLRILPTLGREQVRHLNPDGIRRWWSKLDNTAASAKAYRVLHAICSTAVEDGILRRNPCTVSGGGVERSTERPLVEPDQIVQLIAATPERGRALVMLAVWCTLRRGEILGLERRHVDLLHGELLIEQQVQWETGKGRVIRPPKTDAGERRVQMPSIVAEALEQHLAAYVDPEPSAPVAVGARGRPLSPSGLGKWWDTARSTCGMEAVHLHDLRHAAGTMAAWSGATTRELMGLMGHASPAAALRYQHVAKSRSRDIADALDAIARGEVKRPTVLRTRDMRAIRGEVADMPGYLETGSDQA